MKILFITNYPSPYRVDFWNLLGKNVDLTVSFTSNPEAQKHRSSKWFNTNYDNFQPVFLKNRRKFFGKVICTDIIPLIKEGWDSIVVGGYSSFTDMYAIEYMRLHRIPFYLEADGGMIKEDSWSRRLVKRHFISSASAWFSSGDVTTDYFVHYGAKRDKVYKYPFTSLTEKDVKKAGIKAKSEKEIFRKKLNIVEDKVVLSVGQFIYRKAFDVLIDSASKIKNVGFYIVGGEPTEQYISQVKNLNLTNVHFVGFKNKAELAEYYIASDVFAITTREDIWGLVVNEALSYGLPVVSSDKCVAALELIKDGYNGYIVPVEDSAALAEAINKVLTGNIDNMGSAAYQSIQDYTIENMAKRHLEVLSEH